MSEPNVRPLHVSDFAQLDEWLKSEAEHSHVTHEDFEGVGRRTLVIEDANGVILYARLTKVWRVDLQFNNCATRRRIARGVKKLVEVGSDLARMNGFREIVAETVSKPLFDFMKRLGFRSDPATLRTDIKGVENVFQQRT